MSATNTGSLYVPNADNCELTDHCPGDFQGCYLARVAAKSRECTDATSTRVDVVVNAVVPVTVRAPCGERAISGGQLGATTYFSTRELR